VTVRMDYLNPVDLQRNPKREATLNARVSTLIESTRKIVVFNRLLL
jgi:hypothetical protein